VPITYEPIQTYTLGSAATDITFNSIPSSYTDLRLVLVGTHSTASGVALQFNSDTANNYSRTFLFGNGSVVGSGRNTSTTYIVCGNVGSSIPSLNEIDIFSYAGSTFKTALISGSDDRNGSGTTVKVVGLWRSTSAINSVKIMQPDSFNLNAGTTATLYGIKNA
jgi:hypothetical protein